METANCILKSRCGGALRKLQFAICILQFAIFNLAVTDHVCAGNAAHETPSSEPDSVPESKRETHGISIGEFRIRSYYPVDAQKSIVRFALYATVKDEHYKTATRLIEEHREKLRDQIITATRLAPLTVFQEPDLASFRRRILVRLRRALPELTVEDLYVSEFDLTINSL
jgi:hypothetical protein